MPRWDPASYLAFADERSRPFFDLLGRVAPNDPGTVVDLGCGPGQLTATLAQRWPTAHVIGVDSSPEMIAEAASHASPRVEFTRGDLAEWQPLEPVDVIVSNATLQWVPDHQAVLAPLLAALLPGGWLAFQVPGNFDAPSHSLLRSLAADQRFSKATRGVAWPTSYDAETYLALLAALGCRVEAWETTYLHVLTGPDPVFRWISGTGARPVLQALSQQQRDEFVPEYQALLREAYPEQPFGTTLAFRRIFVVAQRAA